MVNVSANQNSSFLLLMYKCDIIIISYDKSIYLNDICHMQAEHKILIKTTHIDHK